MGRRNSWLKLGLDIWSLGIESSTVIGLRTLKLAAGGAAADAESRRMVEEKLKAGLEWQAMAITGGLGGAPHRVAAKSLAHYRARSAPIGVAFSRGRGCVSGLASYWGGGPALQV